MNPEIPRALEAIVLVADSPIETQLLAELVELPVEQVEELLRGLAAEYLEQGRGFQLVRVAGGWRYQTATDLAPYVERYVLEGQSAKLSAAALETLAIVAYKQPISRAQIATIRGVSVDGVVRTLEQRGYIGEVARDPGPGQAVLFGTTPEFLVKMGLDSLAQLPAIADFVPGADVVEALEHGLRVEVTEPPVSSESPVSSEPPVGSEPPVSSEPAINTEPSVNSEPSVGSEPQAQPQHPGPDPSIQMPESGDDLTAPDPVADERPDLGALLDGDPEA